MIIFNKNSKGSAESVNEIIYRAVNDKSTISDVVIRNLRLFVSDSYSLNSELDLFVDCMNEITSIVRMILLENEFYKFKCLTQATKLGLVLQQEQDVVNHLNLFEMKINLKYKIGKFISKIHKQHKIESNESLDVTRLELNGFILLNNILFTIFNNARCDIYNTTNMYISDNEYLRLFTKFLMSIFREGFHVVNNIAMRDINNYKNNIKFLLTKTLCEKNIDTLVTVESISSNEEKEVASFIDDSKLIVNM